MRSGSRSGVCGRSRSRSGQGLVETALVLMILLVIVFAIFDLGRGFMMYLSVNQAATLAAEYGTRVDSSGSRMVGSNSYPGDTRVADQVRSALGPSVDPACVTAIQVDGSSLIDGKPVLKVDVDYALPMIGPFFSFAFPQGTMRFTGRAGRLFPE